MFKVIRSDDERQSTAPRQGNGQNSDVYMKNIFLVLTLLVAVIPTAIAKTHDRNANPTHRSTYVPPKKAGPKPVSINDRLKKLERETAKSQTGVPAKTKSGAAAFKQNAADRNKPINFQSSKQRASTVHQKGGSVRSTGRRSRTPGLPTARGY
jgi:hypothetical protein